MAVRRSIALTADIGERPGSPGRALDEQLVALLSLAHIACGGHAGDAASMAASIEACLRHGVQIGAHPSDPDREGFGRRTVGLDRAAVAASVVDQVVELATIAQASGAAVSSVKPHGQLYHDLSVDPLLAEIVFSALRGVGVVQVVLAAGAPTAPQGAALGLVIGAEGFCDRRYDAQGGLIPRGEPDALLADPQEAAAQAVSLALAGVRVGERIHPMTSLCVHSDSPGAGALLAAVRTALTAQPTIQLCSG